MSASTPTLSAAPRDRIGTHATRRLRNTGRLPAVIYGHKKDPVSVSIDEKETLGILRHGAHVVNLSIEGGNVETCLIKELQFGFLGDNVIHIDFARVDLSEEVEVKVHIKFVGEPAGAKKPGMILSHDLTELEVLCTVANIPEEIIIDLSKMEETLTVEELPLPEGIRAAMPGDTVVARLSELRGGDEETGEAEEVVAEGSEPEVIAETKRAEKAAADDDKD